MTFCFLNVICRKEKVFTLKRVSQKCVCSFHVKYNLIMNVYSFCFEDITKNIIINHFEKKAI